MTKEEAKLVLDNARPQTKEIDRQFYDDEDLNNALDMAIKALEQQPSDCVSLGVYKQVVWERDIAIEQLKELGYSFGEKIRTSEDCVSRAEVLKQMKEWRDCEFVKMTNPYHYLEKRIQSMSPVKPTHGTCKDCKHNYKISRNTFECSNGHRFELREPSTFYCADFEKRGNEND